MKPRLFQLMLLAAFAIGVGDFAFRTWNPSLTPEYMVEAAVRPLSLVRDSAPSKHLYLRRTWHLTRTPEQAWLQLLGHDALELHVNGRLVSRSPRSSRRGVVAIVTDITPFLHAGKNSVTIHAAQTMLDRPPAVAINGRCEFADRSQLSLDDPEDWRAHDVYDRRGAFWYETEFEDDHWRAPRVGEQVVWRAQVNLPPRAVTEPRRSYWIVPGEASYGAAVMARSFEVPGRPREGWLRVLTTGPYRLAVNGWIVADDRFELGQVEPLDAVERTFDISPLLKSGTNTVSLAVVTAGEAPRARADLEVTTNRGERIYAATDGDWSSMPGHVPNWQLATPSDEGPWQACEAEIGYLQVVPRRILRELGELNPPVAFWLVRSGRYVGTIALCGLAAWFGCLFVANETRRYNPGVDRRDLTALPYVALVPSIVAAFAGWLCTWDLAWSGHDVYRPLWLFGIALLVVVQWLLLLMIAPRQTPAGAEAQTPPATRSSAVDWQRAGFAACWLAIFAGALWLRARDILAEPIHHDEIGAYVFTQSVLERGLPGGQVHPDLPFGYCSTSELAYYPTALCALFVDDPRLVLRIPAVVWSMATLALLGYMGARWFNPTAGLIAGVLYGLSPHVAGWANLGRYLCQVQFFTLLTMFLTYEAFRHPGRVRKGMVWAAAISISAMYLSWEGAGIFGIGLALAVLMLRRDDMRSIVSCPSIYLAIVFVLLVVAGQNAHRIMQQTQRMWYGEGISDLALKPMWRYPFFDVDFFVMNASWISDALLPMTALAAACFMAVRHRWRIPLRFSIICLATNGLLMSALLPLRTNRYAFHLLPLLVLIAAAAVAAGVDMLWRIGREAQFSSLNRAYVRVVAVGALAVFIGLASGRLLRTVELEDFQVAAYDPGKLRYPHWDGPTQYLRDHVREGDVVIATFPHTQNFLMATAGAEADEEQRQVDYWLESTLVIQATIGDSRPLPLDRRSGSVMIYDLEQLQQLFAQHDRVWYSTMRFGQSRINDSSVSRFLRENMDVMYEDFATSVLLRDNNHRPAPVRLEEQEAGRMASDFYLR